MIRLMSKIAVCASIIAVGLAATAPADAFEFPASQFGSLNLRPLQSLGGNDDFIQAQKSGVFEPISEFNADDEIRERARPVGRLSMLVRDENGNEGVGTCTATLVAPEVVLTNYHCIPGFKKNETVVKAIIHFNYLQQDQNSARAYQINIQPIKADSNLDFALLRVPGAPETQFGTMPLRMNQAKPNESLYIYHHPAGLPLRITRFRCRAHAPQAYSGATFRHRCDTLGGSSGSLIFNSDHEVVALHHSGGLTGDSRSSFNAGTAIQAVLQAAGFNAGATATRPVAPAQPVATPTPQAPRFSIARVKPNVSDGYMNVRSGPGLNFQPIGRLPAGATGVEVYDSTCQQSNDGRTKKPWCQVSWNGLNGWVSSGGLTR